jgi:hypothetical protein
MSDGTFFKFKDDLFVVKHIVNSEPIDLKIKTTFIAYNENEEKFTMIAAKENKDLFLLIGFKLFSGIKINVPHYKCFHNGRVKYIPAAFLEEVSNAL